jgi:hypothetical protein
MRNGYLRIFCFGLIVPLACFCALADTAEKAAKSPAPGKHPLDPALDMARDGLKKMQANVTDYTATLVKRERIGGELGDFQYIQIKLRHQRKEEGRVTTPFSVYLKFLAPDSVAGREVIWVEGANDGKLIAHEAGIKGFLRVKLDPTGFIAMAGNRYPINQIGMLNLIEQLIVKGERDRHSGDCEVQFFQNAKVDGRVCTAIQVTHPKQQPQFDFYRAQIFIDKQLNVPIRYAAWTWPTANSDSPVLEEEYTYRDLKLNVGLTDQDFNPDNKAYKFP